MKTEMNVKFSRYILMYYLFRITFSSCHKFMPDVKKMLEFNKTLTLLVIFELYIALEFLLSKIGTQIPLSIFYLLYDQSQGLVRYKLPLRIASKKNQNLEKMEMREKLSKNVPNYDLYGIIKERCLNICLVDNYNI